LRALPDEERIEHNYQRFGFFANERREVRCRTATVGEPMAKMRPACHKNAR
jgi:hypothetical protein